MTKRKQRSRAQWLNLIKQQEESGVKASQFCRQQGLNPQYFSKRKRQLSLNSKSSSQDRAFIKIQSSSKVSTSGVESGISLSYQNIQLQLPTNVEPQWLAQLMGALK